MSRGGHCATIPNSSSRTPQSVLPLAASPDHGPTDLVQRISLTAAVHRASCWAPADLVDHGRAEITTWNASNTVTASGSPSDHVRIATERIQRRRLEPAVKSARVP